MAAIAVIPLLFTVSNSFTGMAGYYEILLARPHYLIKFWQSLGLCAIIVAGQVMVSSLGGYAFAKFRFPGRNIIFFFLIALMMMPLQVMLVPSFMTLDALGLIGSYPALILPIVFSAFGVFLMCQIMSAVPDSLLESAQIDGAGHFDVLMKIMLPNCKAGLASLVILGFIDSWNMVEQPLVYLRDSLRHPFSLFLLQINMVEPTLGFACGVLAMLPVLLLFLFFEEELVSGISYSVLK
jgi:multiple sugar transport system permease protein